MKVCIAMFAVVLAGFANVASAATAATADEKSELFVKDVAKTSMGEVDLGRFVLDKTQNADVKNFAQHMIDDHQKLNDDLKDVSENLGISLPTPLTEDQMALKDRLSKMDGSDFDREFVFAAKKEHKAAIDKFEDYIQTGLNDQVKAFAQRSMPVLKDHLAMARDLSRSFRGTAMADDSANQPIPATYVESEPVSSNVSYERSNEYRTSYSRSDYGGLRSDWDWNFMYENDWRAGETDFVTGTCRDGNCESCHYDWR